MTLYEDTYGRIWELIGPGLVWNKEVGVGLWDDGRGLKRL